MRNKTILLLHGWGSSTSKLAPLAKALEKKGWKTIIPAYPYFDLEEPDTPWDVSAFAEYIKINFLQQKTALVVFGHSFGGRVAIKLASKYPKNISGVVLCSAAGLSRDPLIKRLGFKLLSKALMPLKIFPNIYSLTRRIIYRLSGNMDYYKIASQNKKKTFQLVVAENLKPFARKITLPTLILWGRKDKLTPIQDAHWLKKNIKETDIHIFPDEGHTLPYTRPSELASLIDSWYAAK